MEEHFMIIDTHVHFYDPTRPGGIPWPPEDNELLYRPILPQTFVERTEKMGVAGTVVVEASKLVEDNQWILDLAADNPCVVGFVGSLDPKTEDFEKNLDRFSANPLCRGIRLGLQRGSLEDQETLIPHIQKLADRNLQLDLMTNGKQLPINAVIAEQIPNLRIVIDHVAHVEVTGEAPDPEWVHGIQTIAKHPNVYCKVSGMVERAAQQPAPDDPAYYVPTLDALWNAFGEDRLVYGSNWLVCERAAPYETVLNIVTHYIETKGPEAMEKFFWKNAKAAYKWIDR